MQRTSATWIRVRRAGASITSAPSVTQATPEVTPPTEAHGSTRNGHRDDVDLVTVDGAAVARDGRGGHSPALASTADDGVIGHGSVDATPEDSARDATQSDERGTLIPGRSGGDRRIGSSTTVVPNQMERV